MVFILFLLGLFIGSFLGVLVDRIPQGRTIIKGRSKCDFCNKELKWFELIPVVSFFIQGGKCRNCHKSLSLFYPTIEFTTGILFALTYFFLMVNGQWPMVNFAYNLFIVSSLIIVFFTDLKYGVIPNKIILPGVLVTFIWLIISNQSLTINHLMSALGASVFLILISSIYYFFRKKESIGGGDIKFAFLMGLILGFPNIIVAFYIAFLTGAILSIILILWARLKLKDSIAFGPFLVLGTLTTLYFGKWILSIILPYLGF